MAWPTPKKGSVGLETIKKFHFFLEDLSGFNFVTAKFTSTSNRDWSWEMDPLWKFKTKNCPFILANHLHPRQEQVASNGKRCCAFNRILKVPCTTSCLNQLTRSIYTATIKKHRIEQDLAWRRPEYQQRDDKVILLYINVHSEMSKIVQNYLLTLNAEALPHLAKSLKQTPSDDQRFLSVGHALAEQHFVSYEHARKWLGDCFSSK